MRRRGQRQQPDLHRTGPPRRRPSHHGGLRRLRVWAMRAVIFEYLGTLTDPGAEEYREPVRGLRRRQAGVEVALPGLE